MIKAAWHKDLLIEDLRLPSQNWSDNSDTDKLVFDLSNNLFYISILLFSNAIKPINVDLSGLS